MLWRWVDQRMQVGLVVRCDFWPSNLYEILCFWCSQEAPSVTEKWAFLARGALRFEIHQCYTTPPAVCVGLDGPSEWHVLNWFWINPAPGEGWADDLSWGSGQSKTQLRDYVALTGRFGMAQWYIHFWENLKSDQSLKRYSVFYVIDVAGVRQQHDRSKFRKQPSYLYVTWKSCNGIFSQVSVLEGLIKSTRTDIEEQRFVEIVKSTLRLLKMSQDTWGFWKTWVNVAFTRVASHLQWMADLQVGRIMTPIGQRG